MDTAPVTVNNGLEVSPEENRSVWLALAMPVRNLARAHRDGPHAAGGPGRPGCSGPFVRPNALRDTDGARAKERATPAEPRLSRE